MHLVPYEGLGKMNWIWAVGLLTGGTLAAQDNNGCPPMTLSWLIDESKAVITRGKELEKSDRSIAADIVRNRWGELEKHIDRCPYAESQIWTEEFADLLQQSGMPTKLVEAVKQNATAQPPKCPKNESLEWFYFLTTAIVTPDAAIREVGACGLSTFTPRDLESVLQVAGLDERVLAAAVWVAPTQRSRRNPKDLQAYVKIPNGTLGKREVAGFWMGETEVTEEAWARVMGGKAPTVASRELPHQIGWSDGAPETAAKYCSAIGGRLPTKEEFVYAQRGQRWSKDELEKGLVIPQPIERYAWILTNSSGFEREREIPAELSRERQAQLNNYHPQPVKRKLPNGFGLYDTLGNVDELLKNDENKWAHYRGCGFEHDCRFPYVNDGTFGWLGFRCVWETGTPKEE